MSYFEITVGCGNAISWLTATLLWDQAVCCRSTKVTQAYEQGFLVPILLTLCYDYIHWLFMRQCILDTCLNRFKLVPSGQEFCCVPFFKKVQDLDNWDMYFFSFLFIFLILWFFWVGESTLKVIMLLALGFDFLNTSQVNWSARVYYFLKTKPLPSERREGHV